MQDNKIKERRGKIKKDNVLMFIISHETLSIKSEKKKKKRDKK